MAKLKKPLRKAKTGGEDPKVVAQKEIKTTPKNTYTGAFSNIKAKQAIRKGADESFSVKNRPISGKRVVTQYGSIGNNKPVMEKKTKTSQGYRESKMKLGGNVKKRK
jgi:hypothetical protein